MNGAKIPVIITNRQLRNTRFSSSDLLHIARSSIPLRTMHRSYPNRHRSIPARKRLRIVRTGLESSDLPHRNPDMQRHRISIISEIRKNFLLLRVPHPIDTTCGTRNHDRTGKAGTGRDLRLLGSRRSPTLRRSSRPRTTVQYPDDAERTLPASAAGAHTAAWR